MAGGGPRTWQASAEDITHLPFGSSRLEVDRMSSRNRWNSSNNIGVRAGSAYNNHSSGLLKSRDFSDYSSSSSLESSRTRSREHSRSREHLLSSYDGTDGNGAKTENSHSWRSKFAAETRHQQSPRINILQIKLESGNTCRTASEQQSLRQQRPHWSSSYRANNKEESQQQATANEQLTLETAPLKVSPKVSPLTSPKSIQNRPTVNPREIERLTSDVDVHKKRQKFEGQAVKYGKKKANDAPEPPPRKKSVKQNWNSIREKHCPTTDGIVNEGNGESLRNSILVSEEKLSFRNLKFKKATHVTVGGEEVKLKEVTSTKAFEDRATAILTEMRKQRRTLQLEYVAKVSTPTAKKISGWRDKLNRSDSIKAKEDPEEDVPATGAGYQGAAKRNSMTLLAGKIKRKLSIGKADVGKAEEPHSWRKNVCSSGWSKHGGDDQTTMESAPPKVFNPLDFILMKEDFDRKNPQPPKKSFARERSVESDTGETSMASVMDSLKKIVKAINPKREFPSDIAKREKEEKAKAEAAAAEKTKLREKILENSRPNTWSQGYSSSWEVRMRKYQMGANMPTYNKYASRWNSMQDLRIEPEYKVVDKKAKRERIQNKVLSSVHQAFQDRIEDHFLDCDTVDFSVKGMVRVNPVSYKAPRMTSQQDSQMVLECVEYRKRELVDIIAHFSKDGEQKKRKSCHVKPQLHGSEKGGPANYALLVRSNAPWETVKPFNVAVKKKTELFDAPKAPLVPGRAKVVYEAALMVVLTTSPGTCGTTAYCEQHKWDNLKACALFSIVGSAVDAHPTASETRRLVISLPVSASLGDDEGKSGEQIFHKCERKTQADLIKVSLEPDVPFPPDTLNFWLVHLGSRGPIPPSASLS